jgi:hypothetical protein
MLRKPSCFGFGRSLVPVTTKNLIQSEQSSTSWRTDLERDPRIFPESNPRIDPEFSCDSYNNSRFPCIGNLTTIRLNLVAWRRGSSAERPQIHQIHYIVAQTPLLLRPNAALSPPSPRLSPDPSIGQGHMSSAGRFHWPGRDPGGTSARQHRYRCDPERDVNGWHEAGLPADRLQGAVCQTRDA